MLKTTCSAYNIYTTVNCNSLPKPRKSKEVQFYPQMRRSRKRIQFIGARGGMPIRVHWSMVRILQRLFYRYRGDF